MKENQQVIFVFQNFAESFKSVKIANSQVTVVCNGLEMPFGENGLDYKHFEASVSTTSGNADDFLILYERMQEFYLLIGKKEDEDAKYVEKVERSLGDIRITASETTEGEATKFEKSVNLGYRDEEEADIWKMKYLKLVESCFEFVFKTQVKNESSQAVFAFDYMAFTPYKAKVTGVSYDDDKVVKKWGEIFLECEHGLKVKEEFWLMKIKVKLSLENIKINDKLMKGWFHDLADFVALFFDKSKYELISPSGIIMDYTDEKDPKSGQIHSNFYSTMKNPVNNKTPRIRFDDHDGLMLNFLKDLPDYQSEIHDKFQEIFGLMYRLFFDQDFKWEIPPKDTSRPDPQQGDLFEKTDNKTDEYLDEILKEKKQQSKKEQEEQEHHDQVMAELIERNQKGK